MSSHHHYWRFKDLKRRGIVRNRMTLSRWIRRHGFPQGILLGPNTRAWAQADVVAWLERRPTSESVHEG